MTLTAVIISFLSTRPSSDGKTLKIKFATSYTPATPFEEGREDVWELDGATRFSPFLNKQNRVVSLLPQKLERESTRGENMKGKKHSQRIAKVPYSTHFQEKSKFLPLEFSPSV